MGGIFEAYRAIGYITSSGVPFSVNRLGTETFVTVSVGKAFQVYNVDKKLALVVVGPELPNKIRALATFREFTFVAFANRIAVFKRARQVATWSRHSAKVNYLHLFGNSCLLSVDADGNMLVWDLQRDGGLRDDQSSVGHIIFPHNFTPTCIIHPEAHPNKVLLGSQEGPLHLWNFHTKKLIYQFKGWNSSVTCCVLSPAPDVVAVGCADGKIHLHNILYDEELFTFTHSTKGSVTALSFTTAGQPLLACGDSSGVISIWNLEERRLHSVIREAHDNSIISLHFLAKEPRLMSSAADNSIKVWNFDKSGGINLLHFRSGHSAPPLCIRFYANGRHILSAGQDRAFRLFSVVQDQQSRELSQHHVSKRAKILRVKEEELKLKPVIAFDCAEIRERDWCNVVTCHMDTAQAYVWRLQNYVLGEHVLRPCPENPTPVKACTISACGNFAILGTAGGWIERFNLQSGISRGSYLDVSEKRSYAHEGEVVGVACDSTNVLMISAGYHGDVKVWDFKGLKLKSRLDLKSMLKSGFSKRSLVKIVYHRLNGLLATVMDDWTIRLVDVMTLKIVREFQGHTDRVTDLCFSEDGKWLLSSSMDGTLRIWDVILARQIDAMHVDLSITALSLSPNMDILATTHVDQNGVYLWANQSMYSKSSSTDSYASRKEVVRVKLPSVSSMGGSQVESSDKPDVDNSQSKEVLSLAFLNRQMPELVTLSLLPKSQWQSLINLDILKVRNKPIEPPKKPEKAPFFLPSIPTVSGEILFEPSEPANEENDKKADKEESNPVKLDMSSQFSRLLKSSVEMKNFSAFTDYIKSLSPSTLDMQLRMLQIIDDENQQELEKRPEFISIELLLDYFIDEMSNRNDFEFLQAVIRLFLKIHGETIRSQPKLQKRAQKLLEVQCAVWQTVDRLFQSARCMVAFLGNSQF